MPLTSWTPDFWADAACKGTRAEWFVPDVIEALRMPIGVKVTEAMEQAVYSTGLSFCNKCTVKGDCLAWAESNNETQGLWGGKILDPRPWR